MRDVKILFVFGSIWEKEDEIGDQRIHLQGCAKKFLLSSVRKVLLRLMGCALAA